MNAGIGSGDPQLVHREVAQIAHILRPERTRSRQKLVTLSKRSVSEFNMPGTKRGSAVG
jgi:hypothetical protein